MNSIGISLHAKRLLQFISLLVLVSLLVLPGCGGGGSSDEPSPDPSIAIDSPSVVEGDTGTAEIVFTITLSEDAANTLTVDYTTVDDVATVANDDYTAVSGQLTIPAGSRTANVSVFVNGDSVFEQDETFGLEISNPQGIILSENTFSSVGTISNDDDANPKGYFTGSGTFNGTNYTDVTALAYGNRILLFSPTANVQYDLVITPTGLDYTSGAVEVYVDGNIVQIGAVTVSGTTNELQIQGTFAGGAGFGAGSFDVAFDAGNNVGATLGRIEGELLNRWTGNLYGIDSPDTGTFDVDNAGNYFGTDDTTERCSFPSTTTAILTIPDLNANIYQLLHPIEAQMGFGTCAPPYESTNHTGFAAVVDDTDTDDKLVFAFNNGEIALFGIMNH